MTCPRRAQALPESAERKDSERRRKRTFGDMRKAGGSRGKGGKGGRGGKPRSGSLGNSGPGLKHLGGGFGRKRPKG